MLQCILQEPLLYRVYYLLALSTGLRRGELCALRWQDLHGGNQLLIHHSRSTVVGKGVIEGSFPMDYLISFVVSVMTNIAAYIVRKWIDKQSHDKIKGRCTAIQRPFWCR